MAGDEVGTAPRFSSAAQPISWAPLVLSDSSQSSLLFGLLDTCLEGVGEGAGPGTPLLEKPPQPGEIGQYGAFFIK